MEYILYNSATSLLDSEGNTLLGIPRLLTDEKFRDRVVRQVKNPVVKNFGLINMTGTARISSRRQLRQY